MNRTHKQHRLILQKIAHRVMLERGLLPEFSAQVLSELVKLQAPARSDDKQVRDLKNLPWVSIDDDLSRDLDQLTVAEAVPKDMTKIYVATSDVDSLVRIGSAIDQHARHNTASVYTTALTFPMLPEKLSTNLTSLNFNEDRLSIVVEMVIAGDGSLVDFDIYRAQVRNHAKLAYNSTAAWLEGKSSVPLTIAAIDGLDENLRIQDRVAQKLKSLRLAHGALSFETVEAKAIFDGDEICDLETQKKNRARDLIEDFMIAANGVVVRYLSSRKLPFLVRVVRTPKRWERIVEIANEHSFKLSVEPDSQALEQFLTEQKAADPIGFPDLSLSIIKLIGTGEYVAQLPGDIAPGHFALAVSDYTHSTAPNRRYPDLITQRLVKAAIDGRALPYGNYELEVLAQHCTQEEDVVKKVERQVGKSAAAMLLESRIGERFDAIVTGSASKGTWVRVFHPPVEGKLVYGFEGTDVGNRLRVQLIHTDVEKGFIDFKKVE